MTIASVFWALEATTGGHERLLYLLRGLSDRGHNVVLFTKDEYTFRKGGIEVIELKEGNIPSNKIDSLRAIYFDGVQKARNRGYYNFDTVISFGLGSAIPGTYIKHSFEAPMLLGLRSYPPENIVKKSRLSEIVYRGVTNVYLWGALQSADRVIMQTDAQRNRLVRNQPIRRDKTGVIRNNIRGALEEGTESTRAHELLFVGTLSYRKGIDTLLQALSFLATSTNVHLHVAGEGPMRENALSYVEESGLRDCVSFHGYVQNVKERMRQADLVVIPSRFDSFPNVGLEAMQVGTPFITTEIEDLQSAFGQSTQYVRPGDPEQLAAKVDTLQQPESYRTLREKCLTHRKRFRFDWIERFENEIRSMIQ